MEERIMSIIKVMIAGFVLICVLLIALPALAEEEVVSTIVQVNDYSRAVYEAIKKYGFEFKEPVAVTLVDEKTLLEASKTSGTAGLTRLEYQVVPGGKNLISSEILILSGFSVPIFQRHLAKELCHVWIHQQGNHELHRIFEEGSCEAISFIAVYEIGSPEAAMIMRSIEHNPDTIYGVGFRSVRDYIRQHGMADWRNMIAGHNIYVWAENAFPTTPAETPRIDPVSIVSVEGNSTISNAHNILLPQSNSRASAEVVPDTTIKRYTTIVFTLIQEPSSRFNIKMSIILTSLLIFAIAFLVIIFARYLACHT